MGENKVKITSNENGNISSLFYVFYMGFYACHITIIIKQH